MLNTFLFDIDGTLLDTEMANLGALQQMLKKHYDIDKTIEEMEFALGIPAYKIMDGLGVPLEKSVELWDAQMPDFQHLVEVFPGIFETVNELLNKDMKLGVVTSESREEMKQLVYPYGIVQKFPHNVTSDDTKNHKPHPEPILKALEVTNGDAKNAIYVGDSIYDMQSAHAAGIKFGLASWGAHDRGQFEAADYKFAHPTDLLELL